MDLSAPRELVLGDVRLRVRSGPSWGLVIDGAVDSLGSPSPYLDRVFASAAERERFFGLVDRYGLVVAKNLEVDPAGYRPVRRKRTRGRMSQGELYHHDGCSSDVPPRIVEIRCPAQDVVRSMGTSVARFPQVVGAMIRTLPPTLGRVAELEAAYQALCDGPADPSGFEALQGAVNRVIRSIDADVARAWFLRVDREAGSYTAPWSLCESRFMANYNPNATVQHRRACDPATAAGTPSGGLIKRWPAEELGAPLVVAEPCAPCARAGASLRGPAA